MSTRTAPVIHSGGRIDALALRARLGYREWGAPIPFGPDGYGWRLDTREGYPHGRIIVTSSDTEPAWITHPDQPAGDWIHASISRADHTPTYEDMTRLKAAVWGDHGWAYQVLAPTDHHINIHAHALHLWGRPNGAPVLPNFGALGSI